MIKSKHKKGAARASKVRPTITLTTDFGIDDPFVGIMKGVILTIAPEVNLVDLSHQINPQDIVQAIHVLKSSYAYFPKGTIHLVIIDPGVGGNRRPIAAEYNGYQFVAPDNGVLTPILKLGVRAYELNQTQYFLKLVSSTFHGRDVFAPVAAWLSLGIKISDMGRRITDPQILKLTQPFLKENTLTGHVIYKDRFGNLVTDISSEILHDCFGKEKRLTCKLGRKTIATNISSNYSQLEKNQFGCIINSWNSLEIFCREGDAAKQLDCAVGETITIGRARQ